MASFITSTANLSGAGTFTSGWLVTSTYDTITGTAFSDQAGNLFVEQSFDGTNVDYSATYAVVASTGKPVKEDVVAPYYRLRYVNGASPQTVFRLSGQLRGAAVG